MELSKATVACRECTASLAYRKSTSKHDEAFTSETYSPVK